MQLKSYTYFRSIIYWYEYIIFLICKCICHIPAELIYFTFKEWFELILPPVISISYEITSTNSKNVVLIFTGSMDNSNPSLCCTCDLTYPWSYVTGISTWNQILPNATVGQIEGPWGWYMFEKLFHITMT